MCAAHNLVAPDGHRGRRRSVDVVGSILHVCGQARVVSDERPHRTIRVRGNGSIDMMSAPGTSLPDSPATAAVGADQPARFRLKPPAPRSGYIDGGWWPRARDLAMELPPLMVALAKRLGQVERVGYNLAAWNPSPRKIRFAGRVVRL